MGMQRFLGGVVAVGLLVATGGTWAQEKTAEVADTPSNSVAGVATAGTADAAASAVVASESEAWAATSWQIGTRMTQVKLQDKTRGTPGNGSYFGTITRIYEKQDEWPNKAYLQYRIMNSPVWVGVSYDHVAAQSQDDLSLVPDGSGSDGYEDLQGVVPYIQAAWDNKTRVTPYAQIGLAFYQAKFKPNSWGGDGMRWVSAKSNVNGLQLGGGVDVRLYKNLSLDLFADYMKIDDITGDWYYAYGAHGGPFIMTMSYVSYGGGLSWRF